jgi:F420-dependent oxidoreductase-like protein
MVALSVMIEGQDGLTWPRWQRLIRVAEDAGFAGLFRSDHFTNPHPPELASLEAIVSLTYLADHSQRIHFGTLVAPMSFRDPTLLARQAAALDDLSGRRMILGVGAGWQEREHAMFGHPLGEVPTRMARLEEGLEVLTRLLRSDEPVSFAGRFFQLREAILLPRPARPGGPRLLVGGNGPRRTLPLVARYADIWNGMGLTPEAYRERMATLDALLRAANRPPGAVRRTLMLHTHFGRDTAELERKLAAHGHLSGQSGKSLDEVIAALNGQGRLVGTPDLLIERIRAYGAAGAEEIMLQWFEQEDTAGLEAVAATVLPWL